MLQQQLPGFGGRCAASVAREQGLVQFHLQHAHLAAEHGLGGVERSGGAGKAAEFGHADKVFQLFKFHGLASFSCIFTWHGLRYAVLI